ncbi:gas vesicle protein [Dactylosporangium sp. AC04546]|uniref:gas vesicle protein n=1 Tax=Dactylosporangium sp. AC04546 TaxID=2862460 RepID=UPI001EDD8B1D|nr:gas vesicle protein [Dactylosporangium sp. AC04546]WVK81165.1 gas vesicle protein [Dactylosporangium sp. AC04546]
MTGTVALPERVALADLLDRLLATGVVITGEVTLSIAGVDLVYVSLRALIASAATVHPPRELPP